MVLLVILAAVPVGLQVHVASEREETARREEAQLRAEDQARAASDRLASVNERLLAARAKEATARQELRRAQQDMAAKGLAEGSLDEAQGSERARVEGIRDQADAVAAAIAVQEQLQPAAVACLFDLLRALDRVGLGDDAGAPSKACTTAADLAPRTR